VVLAGEEAMRTCPNCGREFDEPDPYCPNCGAAVITSDKLHMNRISRGCAGAAYILVGLPGAFLGACGIAVWVSTTPEDRELAAIARDLAPLSILVGTLLFAFSLWWLRSTRP
jgi:hypothetical protein